MTPHHMPEGHRLSRVLLYASPCREHGRTSEMAVIVDAKGLANVLEDVGRGYARAAVDAHNFCHGAADPAPWAAAYPVPADYGLFGLPDGWTKLEFVAFPTDHHPLTTKQDRWQLIEFDPEGAGGWAPAGMLIFPERGGPVYVAHGTGDKVELGISRVVTRDGMLSTAAWPAVRELADAIRQERAPAHFHEQGRMGG